MIRVPTLDMSPDQANENLTGRHGCRSVAHHSGEGKVMSQGPRRGWVRAVFTGIAAVLCAGAIGCTDLDKPKDTKLGANAKQPGPGLPGTARLPGAAGSGVGAAGMGQPSQFQGIGNGAQPIGGVNRAAGGSGFAAPGGTGAGMQPGAGSNQYGTVPSAGPIGAGVPTYSAGPNAYAPPAGGAPAYALQPLGDPGLAPPPAPGGVGGPVAPPVGGPVSPGYR